MKNVTIENGDRNFIMINGKRSKNRISGSYTKEKNMIPSFTFDIYPDNIGFAQLYEYKTVVRVTNPITGKQEFAGRVILIAPNMDSSGIFYKSVVCEGWLGLLNDSINYLYDGNMDGSTQAKIVYQLIMNHNSQVEEEKQIRFSMFESNNIVENCEPSYERTTWEALADEQLTEDLSYEINETFDHQMISHKYLECHADGIQPSDTEIKLGLNMQSLSITNNFDELCTVCLPLTSEGLPMGIIGKDTVTVEDSAAINNYGRIVKMHKFESIKKTANLEKAAKKWLIRNCKVVQTVSVNCIDLSGLGLSPEEFDINKSYHIECEPLKISERRELTKITRDVNDEWNVQLTFGDVNYSVRKKIQYA